MLFSKTDTLLLSILSVCSGAPIHSYDTSLSEVPFVISSHFAIFLSVGFFVLCGLAIFGCTCWQHKDIGVTENCGGQPETNVSQLQNRSEFAIFPPCSSVISLQPVHSSLYGDEDKVIFEPLPDILPKRHVNGQNLAQSSKPAHFSALLKKKSSLHDWFDDPSSNFPRNQLQYYQEIGSGWFGRVVQGEAHMITSGEEKTPVIVKILREEASPSEHLYFLHEVKPYRDLHHPNVVRLLGRCLESDPFLLIMECTVMSLKTYLINKHDELVEESAAGSRRLMKIASDIVAGLVNMHENNFVHTDLAAHNCFIGQDDIVKIGDYGTSFDMFRDDYYCLEDIALPIRWYSPESLHCSETTIETQEVTKEANVWALGIVLWEILELGKLPYSELTNEEVLQKVIIDKELFPKEPQNVYLYKKQMYEIMRLCWEPLSFRPKVQDIQNMLYELQEQAFSKSSTSFEHRWNALQSKGNSSSLKFENDFVGCSHVHNANFVSSSDCNLSDSSVFDVSGCDSTRESCNSYRSPSLRALNGSYDEIGCTETDPRYECAESFIGPSVEGSSQSVTTDTSKDIFYDKSEMDVTPEQITAALRDLDTMLASESSLWGGDSRSSTWERPKGRREGQKCIGRKGAYGYEEDFCKSTSNYRHVLNSSHLAKHNSMEDGHGSLDVIHGMQQNSCPAAKVGESAFDEVLSRNPDDCLFSESNISMCPRSDISSDGSQAYVYQGVQNLLHTKLKDPYQNADETSSAGTGCDSDFQDVSVEPEVLKYSDPLNCSSNSEGHVTAKLFPVPEILVTDASALCSQDDSSHDEVAQLPVNFASPPKKYRFVLKDEPDGTRDSKTAVPAPLPHVGGLADIREQLIRGSSESAGPFTSTPKKNCDSIVKFDTELSAGLMNSENPDVNESNFDVCSSASTAYGAAVSEAPSETHTIVDPSKPDNSMSLPNIEKKDETDFFTATESHGKYAESDLMSRGTSFFSAVTETNDQPRSKSISSVSEDSFITFNCSQTDSSCDSIDMNQTQKSGYSLLNEAAEHVNKMDYYDDKGVHDSVFISESSCRSKSFKDQEDDSIHVICSDSAVHEDDMNITELPNEQFVSSAAEHELSQWCSTAAAGDVCYKDEGNGNFKDVAELASTECAVISLSNEGDETAMSDITSDSFVFKKNCLWNNETVSSASENAECVSVVPEQSIDNSISFVYNKLDGTTEQDKDILFIKSSKIENGDINNGTSHLYNDHSVNCADSGDFLQPGSDAYCNANNSSSSWGSHAGEDAARQEVQVMDLEGGNRLDVPDPDEYDSQIDSEEVLKVDIETNEAILVDTTESLIGFVPSRSIEMLQECDCLVSQFESSHSFDEEEEDHRCSSPVTNSPCLTTDNSTGENPGSFLHLRHHDADDMRSGGLSDDNMTGDCSSSPPKSEGYSGSDEAAEVEGSDAVQSKSSSDSSDGVHLYNGSYHPPDIMFAQGNRKPVLRRNSDSLNNNNNPDKWEHPHKRQKSNLHDDNDEDEDLLDNHRSVPWNSEETLDLLNNDLNVLRRSVIIEGKEILAGSNSPSCQCSDDPDDELPAAEFGSSDFLDRLAVSASPSPMGSAASTPCREVYTPDFESESVESSSSCSSTSGSFECIHNKFKDIGDIALASNNKEVTPPCEENDDSSPLKVFSKTWDCHATPNKGLLKSPEKKVEPMRKSVSFHEDPQLVFQYPPASDSSEEEYPDEEEVPWSVDYTNYADWELQAGEEEEIPEMIEIEELESEPYNRSLGYRGISSRPFAGPSLYTLTGFSEEDLDSSLPDMTDSLSPPPPSQNTNDGGNQADVSSHESIVYHSSLTHNIDRKEDLRTDIYSELKNCDILSIHGTVNMPVAQPAQLNKCAEDAEKAELVMPPASDASVLQETEGSAEEINAAKSNTFVISTSEGKEEITIEEVLVQSEGDLSKVENDGDISIESESTEHESLTWENDDLHVHASDAPIVMHKEESFVPVASGIVFHESVAGRGGMCLRGSRTCIAKDTIIEETEDEESAISAADDVSEHCSLGDTTFGNPPKKDLVTSGIGFEHATTVGTSAAHADVLGAAVEGNKADATPINGGNSNDPRIDGAVSHDSVSGGSRAVRSTPESNSEPDNKRSGTGHYSFECSGVNGDCSATSPSSVVEDELQTTGPVSNIESSHKPNVDNKPHIAVGSETDSTEETEALPEGIGSCVSGSPFDEDTGKVNEALCLTEKEVLSGKYGTNSVPDSASPAIETQPAQTNSVKFTGIPDILITDGAEEMCDEELDSFLSEHLSLYNSDAANDPDFNEEFPVVASFSESPFEEDFHNSLDRLRGSDPSSRKPSCVTEKCESDHQARPLLVGKLVSSCEESTAHLPGCKTQESNSSPTLPQSALGT